MIDSYRSLLLLPLLLLLGIPGTFLMTAVADDDGPPAPTPNTLTDAQRDAGWRLLFDGKSTAGWRGYKADAVAPSWKVVDGSLISKPAPGEATGYLLTVEQFDNFELAFEWKVSRGTNSGVFYRVTEDAENPWDTGPEYQVLDNTRHLDGNNPLSSASGCYAVYPPARDLTRPVGQWNQARVVADGNHVEHWLNGERVVAYDIGSDNWRAHLKTSRFWNTPGWGRAPKGHLCIQDYGDPIEFRNLKLRPLPARKPLAQARREPVEPARPARPESRPAPQPSRYRYTLEFDKETLPKGVTVREVKIGDGQVVRYMVKNTSDTPLIFNDKYSAGRLVAGDKVVSGKAYQYFPSGVPMEGKQHLKGWQAPFGDMEEAAILLTKDPSKIAEGRKPGLGKELPPPESATIEVKYNDKPHELKVTIHYHLNPAYDE